MAAAMAVVAACSGGGDDPPDATDLAPTSAAESSDATTDAEPGVEPPPDTALPAADDPPVDVPPLDESGPPPLAVIDADPLIAAPGTPIELDGLPAGVASVTLLGPGGPVEAPVDGAALVVPDGVAPGTYSIRATGDGAVFAVGRVDVADGPTVVVRPDRTTVPSTGLVALDVSVTGVDPSAGLLVATGSMADLFGGTGTGDEEIGEGGALLAPSEQGVLLPWQPGPLAPGDGASQRLLLPAAFLQDGPLRVMVGDPLSGALPVVSDEVRVRVCDTDGRVTGDIGRAGVVRVLSFATGALRAEWVETPDGRFEADVPAGPAAVIGSDAESVDDPVIVDVPCGAAVDTSGAAAVSGIARRTPAPTRRQAEGGGEPCRTALILEMPRDDTGRFSGMSGMLATRLLDAAPRLSVVTALDLLALVQLDAMQQLLGAEENSVMLETIGARMDADFLVHGGVYDLDGTWGAAMTALARTDTDVDVRVSAGGDISAAMESAVEQMAFELPDAALCAELDPVEAALVPGDEQQFTLAVTTLAGSAADGTSITVGGVAHGSVDPTDGFVEGTTFEFTYTAEDEGVDTLAVEGEWRDGRAPGTVRLAAEGTVTVGGGYVLDATAGLDPAAADGALGGFAVSLLPKYAAEAQACGEPPSGPWTGTLDVDGSGLLAALGPAALGGSLLGDVGLDVPDVGDISPDDLKGTFDITWEAPPDGGEVPVEGGFPGLRAWYVPPATMVFLTDAGPFMDAGIRVVEPGEPPCG